MDTRLTLIILGGLAVGAFVGYQMAPRIIGYQPYSFLYKRFQPAAQVIDALNTQAQTQGQIAGGVALAPLQAVVAEGKQLVSGFHDLADQIGF
jgi:hypothetical protein